MHWLKRIEVVVMPMVVKLLLSGKERKGVRACCGAASNYILSSLTDILHDYHTVSIHHPRDIVEAFSIRVLTAQTTAATVRRVSRLIASPSLDSRCILGIVTDDIAHCNFLDSLELPLILTNAAQVQCLGHRCTRLRLR